MSEAATKESKEGHLVKRPYNPAPTDLSSQVGCRVGDSSTAPLSSDTTEISMPSTASAYFAFRDLDFVSGFWSCSLT